MEQQHNLEQGVWTRLPDTMNYSFFLDNPPSNTFLFTVRLNKNFRPSVGDSLTDPLTQREFRVMRDEFAFGGLIRITDDDRIRITDDGTIRVTSQLLPSKDVTHTYFVLPANKPTRISTWTRTDFANDRTLDKLFNGRVN